MSQTFFIFIEPNSDVSETKRKLKDLLPGDWSDEIDSDDDSLCVVIKDNLHIGLYERNVFADPAEHDEWRTYRQVMILNPLRTFPENDRPGDVVIEYASKIARQFGWGVLAYVDLLTRLYLSE